MYVSRDVKFDEGRGYYSEKNWDSLKDMKSSGIDRAATLKFIVNGLNSLIGNKNVAPEEERVNNQTEATQGETSDYTSSDSHEVENTNESTKEEY